MPGFRLQTMLVGLRDRIRDPALTTLLGLELCLIFLAVPLAAKGVTIAKPVVETMVLATIAVVVMLSPKRGEVAAIFVGFAALVASLSLDGGSSPIPPRVLHWGGDIVTFLALIWVVGHAVYAPGRITFHRLRGAEVVYLNVAIVFTAAFSLIWELNPAAFAGVLTASDDVVAEFATMIYFSLTSLTTTGYGDIAPLDPFARSLANFESAIGVFYIALTVARLVTLELEDRRLAAETRARRT